MAPRRREPASTRGCRSVATNWAGQGRAGSSRGADNFLDLGFDQDLQPPALQLASKWASPLFS
jgi:hypothetical protein